MSCLAVWGQSTAIADDFTASSAAFQAAASRPAPKSNSKLRWLPYQPAKVKTDAEVRAVQYTEVASDTDWSATQKAPTLAVRPTPGRTSPPNSLNDATEEPKPGLMRASPSELENLSSAPSEPADDGNASLALDNPANTPFVQETSPSDSRSSQPEQTPQWTPSNNKPSPNGYKPYENNNSNNNNPTPGLEPPKSTTIREQNCLSVKDLKPISKVNADITTVQGEVPRDCPWGDDKAFTGRCWNSLTFTWTASALCHKPLYFEDVKLERYGHMWGPWLQPIISHARFFGTVLILPYEMGLEPPKECMYTLGYYRPGSCAPYYLDPIPLSVRAALFEGGVIAGGIAVIP